MNAQASAEAKEAAKRKAIAERRKILSEGGVKGFVKFEDVLNGWFLAQYYIMLTLSQEESRDKAQF